MKRLECLDGLRGVLAVYVLMGHLAPFALLPGVIQAAVSHGGAAVDMFFVLSGLVITLSLDRVGGQARPFLIARAMRIFPVFLPVFALAVAVQPLSCGFDRMPWIGPGGPGTTICGSLWPNTWVAEIAAHLTMTHGLFPNAILPDVWISFLGAAWSLSSEWQFYLLALLVAGRPRLLIWLLLSLAAAAVAWCIAGPDAWQFSRAFLPNKAHFFALGVASLPMLRREPTAVARYAITLAACLVICGTLGQIGKMLPPLAWTLCLLTILQPDLPVLRALGWSLRSAAARYLGSISYCLYLVNEPIHKIIMTGLNRLADGDAAVFTLLWLPTATVTPILVAIWLNRTLAEPALRRGHPAAAVPRRAAVAG